MDDAVKRRLLHLARRSIEAELSDCPPPPIDEDWPDLPHAGAFVTLRRRKHLRGCIGTFRPCGALPQTVQEMAQAACHDPRFVDSPITCRELDDLRVEISMLSPLERTDDPLSLELGRHGVYLRRGSHSGCFLPQVATEMRWDKQTFLSQCCAHKAGLPAGAWQDPETEVYLFTTESFSEEDFEDAGRPQSA